MKYLKMVLKTIFSGVIIGVIIGLYQRLAQILNNLSQNIYYNPSSLNYLFMVILAVILFIIANYISKKAFCVAGSGIPYVELTVEHKWNLKYYLALPAIFVNSLIAFFFGLSLGSEGPSATMGACLGLITNKIFKDDDTDTIKASMGAGFGCAFLAPLAGIVYTIENSYKKGISVILIIKTIITVLSAIIITRLINNHKIIEIDIENGFVFQDYLIIIVISIMTLLISIIFIKGIISLKDFLDKYKTNNIVQNRLIFIFLIFIALGFLIPSQVGGGVNTINFLLNRNIFNISFSVLVFLLTLKLFLTIICANAKISGGLLIPTLAIGAITGALIYKLFMPFLSNDVLYLCILLSMLSLFAYTTKLPLTAICLAINFASYKIVLLPMVIIMIILSIFRYFVKTESIYEELKKRIRVAN